MRGKFITFEGSEGCGKSTQSRLIFNYLKGIGYRVIYLREPGGTSISEQIRKILLSPKNKAMTANCELLLYMASRNQLVEEVIKPALKKGTIVISDRFLDSTFAYQGYGLGMNLELINYIGNFSTLKIKPHLTIFLDLSLSKALRAIGRVKDRIEKRSLSYHNRVRKGYLRMAKQEPGRIKVIKVEEDKFRTQEKIRETILRVI